MKAEHNQENVIKNLAKIGQYIDDLNADRMANEKIDIPVERALDKITPSWRVYAHDIWVGHDLNVDMDMEQRTALVPKEGAVVTSQFGDQFTIETQDIDEEFFIVVSVKGQTAIVKFEVESNDFFCYLGKYSSDWALSYKNQLAFQDYLLLYALEQVTNALQNGKCFTMPPTNMNNFGVRFDSIDNNVECPF